MLTRPIHQVKDLQDSVRGKNTTSVKMKQTLVEREKDQDTLLQQLDEKTEKIHEMSHKFMKQVLPGYFTSGLVLC